MSRFVSAGTNEQPTERDEAWIKAQQQIEATQRSKAESGKQQDGKSLYETLQANKAAKQEAFEESMRLKNQFRSLDDDEADFLESMLASSRSKEAEVKRETKEQLEEFRRQQEDAARAAEREMSGGAPQESERWSMGPRQRKRGREKEGIGGVKVRRTSTVTDHKVEPTAPHTPQTDHQHVESSVTSTNFDPPMEPQSAPNEPLEQSPLPVPASTPHSGPALGLVAYSSDEE